MSDNTTHPVHTPEDCPTYHDGCNCRERIATLETRVEVEVELRKASYERITELEDAIRALYSNPSDMPITSGSRIHTIIMSALNREATDD